MAIRSRAPLVLLTALVAASGLGCRDEEPAASARPVAELETVDVAPPPDANVDPSRDVQERRRAETFAGVLPEAFPQGFPLPPGASLVDQGPRWVELLVGRRSATVEPQYLAQLRAAGWRVTTAGGQHRVERRGTSVRARLSAAGPSTRIRLDY
jgi:hypothetical protein